VKLGTPDIEVSEISGRSRTQGFRTSRARLWRRCRLSCDQWNYLFTGRRASKAPNLANGCFPRAIGSDCGIRVLVRVAQAAALRLVRFAKPLTGGVAGFDESKCFPRVSSSAISPKWVLNETVPGGHTTATRFRSCAASADRQLRPELRSKNAGV
jgi:hypothetical protein